MFAKPGDGAGAGNRAGPQRPLPAPRDRQRDVDGHHAEGELEGLLVAFQGEPVPCPSVPVAGYDILLDRSQDRELGVLAGQGDAGPGAFDVAAREEREAVRGAVDEDVAHVEVARRPLCGERQDGGPRVAGALGHEREVDLGHGLGERLKRRTDRSHWPRPPRSSSGHAPACAAGRRRLSAPRAAREPRPPRHGWRGVSSG